MKALSLRSFIGARLRFSAVVTALVPTSNILDDYARPERFPCIIIRHNQPTSFERIENTLAYGRKFAEMREIAGHQARFLPRYDGAYSHGILSVEANLQGARNA